MTVLFFVSALASEIIGTIVGFGSSTVFLPLALQFFDFRTALVLVAFLHISGNIGRITFFKAGLDKSILLKFGLPSIVFTLVGALIVSLIPQDLFKAILGAFLIVYAAVFLCKENLQLKPTVSNSILGGSLSGFLAGMIGTGGALRGAYLTAFRLPKERYIATAASIALAVDLIRIPVYLNQGFLDSKFYLYLPILFAIAFTGSFFGRQIAKRIPQASFKKIVLIAILLTGTKFILSLIHI